MHSTFALNHEAIDAAAAAQGISGRAELLEHLGLLAVEPATVAVVATIASRLRMPVSRVCRVVSTPLAEPLRLRLIG